MSSNLNIICHVIVIVIFSVIHIPCLCVVAFICSWFPSRNHEVRGTKPVAPKNTEDDDNEDDKPDPGSQSSEETLTGLLECVV